MSKNLVIVESPAKAKTIEKYLGSDFRVLSSVGHIRKDVKVDVNNNFAVTYEVDPGHQKIVSDLKKAVKQSDTIWLATDEDREGESISWHLIEVLGLPRDTKRITFHEITKSALEHAIKTPRTVDMDIVASQQARQTLDMLVGYDLSGVVRRKVPGAISAGRVQSPALRLIVEREQEITEFSSSFTFKITGDFGFPQFQATLEKSKFSKLESVEQLFQQLAGADYLVADVKESESKRSTVTPFATASLQIEANSKLGFSSKTTMSAAQGLYQAGLITYHRTDSLNLSASSLKAIGTYIQQTFGDTYHELRHFKTKSASAQEAHEAIRPTDITVEVAGKNSYEQKLYQLIHARTLATQMAAPRVAKTTVQLVPANVKLDKDIMFVAKGEVIIFDGYLKVYGKNKDTTLPKLIPGTPVKCHQLTAKQTFANPPARFTEGSLVKKLEELGIGRPSTYASIISAIQTRKYVIKGESEGQPRDCIVATLNNTNQTIDTQTITETHGSNKGKLIPTPVGELISGFLLEHFEQIVNYDFTANIEQKLDKIAERQLDKIAMLKAFYDPFSQLVYQSSGVDRYNSAILLGQDPKTNKPIYAKIGRNGGFIQLGDNEKTTGEKPLFYPLPPDATVKTVTLELALRQMTLPTLPRSLGQASDHTELIAASGPFGPYLKAGKYNIPLGNHDPYTITLTDAIELYNTKKASILADWDDVMIINGAYGAYIKGPGKRNNLRIPKDLDPTTITEAQARELLANKQRTTNTHSGKSTKTTKAAKKPTKSSTKKTTTQKTATTKRRSTPKTTS